MPSEIILASTSSSRKSLMSGAGLAFRAIAADIDERSIEQQLGENVAPTKVAAALADAKALDVSARYPDVYVIGSDQTLSLGKRIFHKARDMAEAADNIAAFAGKTHHLNCGVSIARNNAIVWSTVSIAAMTMWQIPESLIRTYLDLAGPSILQSVGAYQLEGPGIRLFEKIEGDYFTILGLPMLQLLAGLRQLGAIDV